SSSADGSLADGCGYGTCRGNDNRFDPHTFCSEEAMRNDRVQRLLRKVLGCCALLLACSALASAALPGVSGEAFAPRSGPRGATMFTKLPPQQTGVTTENRYADPRMWGEYYQELVYGTIGTGVAIGDYDDDGRPDIFVVSKTEQSRLFRNLGGWKFQDVTDAAGLGVASTNWTDTVKNWMGVGTKNSGLVE